MQAKRKLIRAGAVFLLAMVVMSFVARAQDNEARVAHSSGQGVLKVGDEKFKITSVVVKLGADRKAELTLSSDITFFISGTWSNHTESQQEVDLEITGGATPGGLAAKGKVFLSSDGKSVARLSLKGISRTTKRAIDVNFEGK
jgi:hypothetical protein